MRPNFFANFVTECEKQASQFRLHVRFLLVGNSNLLMQSKQYIVCSSREKEVLKSKNGLELTILKLGCWRRKQKSAYENVLIFLSSLWFSHYRIVSKMHWKLPNKSFFLIQLIHKWTQYYNNAYNILYVYKSKVKT